MEECKCHCHKIKPEVCICKQLKCEHCNPQFTTELCRPNAHPIGVNFEWHVNPDAKRTILNDQPTTNRQDVWEEDFDSLLKQLDGKKIWLANGIQSDSMSVEVIKGFISHHFIQKSHLKEQVDGIRNTREWHEDQITHGDEELKKIQAISMYIGHNKACNEFLKLIS